MIWKDVWLEIISAGRSGRMVGWKTLTGTRLRGPEGCLVGNWERTPDGGIRRIFGRKA